MADFDEDPLDLLEDDGDGVIEILTVLKEDEEEPILERTGCLGLVAAVALPASLICYALSSL